MNAPHYPRLKNHQNYIESKLKFMIRQHDERKYWSWQFSDALRRHPDVDKYIIQSLTF
jgi:hypothetical protein